MRTLMLRIVSDEWGVDTEPRIAIVRLDTDPRRTRTEPDALRRRFASFAMVVEGMVMSGVNRVAALRADDVVNRLVTVDYAGTGGALDDQWYQEGCFALADDEVLVLETPLDPECRAFSLALTDTFFSTLDWANAQSSLNRRQAVVDADGILRVVVASGGSRASTTGSTPPATRPACSSSAGRARSRRPTSRCGPSPPTRSTTRSPPGSRARPPSNAPTRSAPGRPACNCARTGRCDATWGSRRRRRPR